MATAPARELNGTLREVGARIRLARQRRGLTLAHVGRTTGLTPSMLSMVERGVATPSIGALVAISAALKVSMAALFGPVLAGTPSASPVIRRARQPVVTTGRGVQRRIVARDRRGAVELAENIYQPGAASAEGPLRHLGRELGVVLAGRLRVELGRAVYVLRPGDAIAFDSSTPHRFTTVGREVARTLWINLHGTRWSED
jgi:transcriptional regulator with XRE-family HTH domain